MYALFRFGKCSYVTAYPLTVAYSSRQAPYKSLVGIYDDNIQRSAHNLIIKPPVILMLLKKSIYLKIQKIKLSLRLIDLKNWFLSHKIINEWKNPEDLDRFLWREPEFQDPFSIKMINTFERPERVRHFSKNVNALYTSIFVLSTGEHLNILLHFCIFF